MKRNFFAVILLGTMLLSGCNATVEAPEPAQTPTPELTVEPADVPEASFEPTVEPNEPIEDKWISLTEEELQWFNEKFFNTDEEVKKNDFLNCIYTDVRSISIYEVFYNLSEKISPEERKALRGSEIDFGVDYQKLTVPYMDGILKEYMNVSFGEIDKVDLDYYLYLEEFDAYFGSHGDTNYSSIEVKSGTKDGNGNVKLQYLRREDGKEYVMTLKQHANGYYFVSNCAVETQ